RKAAAPSERPAPAPAAPKRAKLSYKDQRDYELLPQQIEKLDQRIAADEAALADPALYARDPKRFQALSDAIAAARAEKDAAELRWLELAEQVEALG
ncbi:ABC transporter C-terminal domain-containing protein, partial [Sphingomonas sp. CCH13-B11]